MIISGIEVILKEKSEEKYRNFSIKLICESSLPLLGVRLPAIKKIASDICKANKAESFLNECYFSSIEMCYLYSYVLGKTKFDIDTLLNYFDRVAKTVDNWSTCDILCQSFKQATKNRQKVYEHMQDYLNSGETFYMRIAVVTLMSHFMTEEYIDNIFDILNTYKNDGYYYKMGVAWCVATAMAKFPQKTYEFLYNTSLDNTTFNKAIQKMLESRRVSDKDKEILRKMKRK